MGKCPHRKYNGGQDMSNYTKNSWGEELSAIPMLYLYLFINRQIKVLSTLNNTFIYYYVMYLNWYLSMQWPVSTYS